MTVLQVRTVTVFPVTMAPEVLTAMPVPQVFPDEAVSQENKVRTVCAVDLAERVGTAVLVHVAQLAVLAMTVHQVLTVPQALLAQTVMPVLTAPTVFQA